MSPEILQQDGLLTASEVEDLRVSREGRVDYGAMIPRRTAMLRHVAANFAARAGTGLRRELEDFRGRRAAWLPDLATYLALKQAHGGAPWTAWEPALARRERTALDAAMPTMRMTSATTACGV